MKSQWKLTAMTEGTISTPAKQSKLAKHKPRFNLCGHMDDLKELVKPPCGVQTSS